MALKIEGNVTIQNYVESGATVNNVHIDHVDNLYTQQAVTSDAPAAPADLATMTPMERAAYAVRVLVREGAVRYKREWTAVMRVARERNLLPAMSSADFVHLLAESEVPEKLMPSVSCIDKTYIGKAFPEWEFVDIEAAGGERMKRIAERFINLCTE